MSATEHSFLLRTTLCNAVIFDSWRVGFAATLCRNEQRHSRPPGMVFCARLYEAVIYQHRRIPAMRTILSDAYPDTPAFRMILRLGSALSVNEV